MKFYQLRDPCDYQFAQFGRRGTWSQGTGLCLECTASTQKRIHPLIIEWERGSDKIGDFIWADFSSDVVVRQKVREILEKKYNNLVFHPIEMIQSPSLKRPMKITKRTVPRVWLPYEGEVLWEFQITSICKLDLELSHIYIEKICSTCGHVFYKLPEKRYEYIIPSTWDGNDVFSIINRENRLFCTEKAKLFIELQCFSNVKFELMGEISR